MVSQEHLDKFSTTLKGILDAELKLGNTVAETGEGWPTDNGIIVFLRVPFKGRYSMQQIEFREINDPHYWLSEYFDHTTGHILACKYE